MKRLNLSLPIFVSLLFSAIPASNSACGFDPDDYFSAYSFFDPSVSATEDMAPFFLSFDAFYEGPWDADSFRQRDNVREWQLYFGEKKVSQADVRTFVYQASPEILGELKDWAEGNGSPPAGEWADNELAQLWKRKKWSVPICYMEYAKRCEPHASINADAWEFPDRDPAKMQALIDEGLNKYEVTKDQFVKMRYGYQLIRLAHYSENYQQAIDFFDELIAPLKEKVESQIYYWALGHKAGALWALGQTTESNYLFSRVFEMCPAKRKSAWLSFRVSEDADWQALMDRCTNSEERANLVLMRGIQPYSQSLEEMESLYDLAPNSPKLDLLLVREINKLEEDLMDYSTAFKFPMQVDFPAQDHKRALDDLLALTRFVEKIKKQGGVASPWLWDMADGYLKFIEGDFQGASAILRTVSLQTQQKRAEELRALFQWAIQISQLKSLPLATEDRLYKTWQEFDFSPDNHLLADKSQDFMLRRFERLHQEAGEIGKAFLSRKDIYELYYYPDGDLVDRLLSWQDEQKDRNFTSYEEMLLKKLGGATAREKLLEIRATMHLARGEWQEAIDIYESLPASILSNIPSFEVKEDPFMPMLQDCLECFESRGDTYTRLALAKKLKELEEASSVDPDAAMLMGHAIYNMSFFGHSWMAAGYFRSGGHYEYYDFESEEEDPAFDRDFIAMERAEAYYESAYKMFEDPEKKAEALFMAAKCEQNRFYLHGFDDYRHLDQKAAYRTNFNLLTRDYKETAFYGTAIGVCAWLDMYAWIQEN